MNILIGNAWPYANGSLHIGHIAALLPGDILARYFRAKGNTVFFVSGSDCHGTPVTIRARQENRTPQEVCDYYHNEFTSCFTNLGFSYDHYGKTSSEEHKSFVTDFHRKLYNGGYVYEKSIPQAFCSVCNQFLPDRFVRGICPHCAKNARGDQCEACGNVLDPENLIQAECSLCGKTPEFRPSKHLFLAVTKLILELDNYIESHKDWRRNAFEMSKRYIREGLRDRSLTRDLDWGIDVPQVGFEGKKIYIWAENVLGYLSGCYTLCREQGLDFSKVWNNCRQYFVHGKDNIPFHTIILPSLLLARTDVKLKLPDEIISSEYLTLEGRKISTSGNWAIWVKDILERYSADSIRYFLIANGPEKRDTDFTWREFINSHNGELLGAYGNFVNRSLVFIRKYFEARVPMAQINTKFKQTLASLYSKVGLLIEHGDFKEALETVFTFIRSANKYFDEEQPWITIKSDVEKCRETLNTCIQIIANLSILLEPFLPFSSARVKSMLGIEETAWQYTEVVSGFELESIQLLFERIDKKVIEEEEMLLKGQYAV
ncbi:MAG: methionine--tRNA ligase [Clostridiales bacterium GWC2_40_7]|nr:MAG: methionine--tRNA ligase [Clostridiales bacterium GWC2_40_7]